MKKVLVSLMFGALILTGTSFAQNPPTAAAPEPTPAPAVTVVAVHHDRDHYPEIHKAMRKLRGAKQDLQKAAHDFGGHKVKAIAAINEALHELQAAISDAKAHS